MSQMPQIGARQPQRAFKVTFAIVMGAAFALCIFTSGGADARKKRPQLAKRCTTAQLKTKEAEECMNKGDDDLLFNRKTVHYVYCSSSGRILCCEQDQESNPIDGTCTVVKGSSRPAPPTKVVPKAPVGGAEVPERFPTKVVPGVRPGGAEQPEQKRFPTKVQPNLRPGGAEQPATTAPNADGGSEPQLR